MSKRLARWSSQASGRCARLHRYGVCRYRGRRRSRPTPRPPWVAGPGHRRGVSDTTQRRREHRALAAAPLPMRSPSYRVRSDARPGCRPHFLRPAARRAALRPRAQPQRFRRSKIVCWTNAVWGRWGSGRTTRRSPTATYWCGHFGGGKSRTERRPPQPERHLLRCELGARAA